MDEFLSAIRAKPGWPLKVLDEDRNLCEKWVKEGKLEEELGLEREIIDSAIRDLKHEARKIITFDSISLLMEEKDAPVDTADWEAIEKDVQDALEEANKLIQTPELGDVCGVRVADGMVPKSLHRVLEEGLDNFARESVVPDYHPKSDGKVLDIIHPSLYPYVHGSTPLSEEQAPKGEGFDTTVTLQHSHPYGDEPEPVEHSSKFAWLPSIFRVSPSGDSTRIISYINNLGPRSSHPSLYKAIEHLFTIALPMIQQSLDEKLELVDTPSFQRWEERASTTGDNWTGKEGQKLSEWRALLMEQKRQEREDRKFARKVSEFQPSEKGLRGPLDLKGKDLKVIVKVAEYHLKPGQGYSGSWHIEGAPHEMIASSFIYYYSTSKEIEDDGLALRRVRLDVDPPNEEENHGDQFSTYLYDDDGNSIDEDRSSAPSDAPNYDFPSDWGSDFDPYSFPGAVRLGVVPTTGIEDAKGGTGRLLSFPNWIQHQVKGLRRTITDPPSELPIAKRKILCFFIVREDRDESNPDTISVPGITYSCLTSLPPVITTSQIPPQQYSYTFPSTHFWLSRAFERTLNPSPSSRTEGQASTRTLPMEIFLKIFAGAGIGMGREEAERVRREVMLDRGMLGRKEGQAWEGEFGLCEH
ncbi:hypothetical protein BDY24DRAFT_395433 [Mrakia frigida]|uniref:uncharacterized protein n=1 Tax=Mrakia frigida TaxID=29902 RepID=UPI003FCBF59A